MSKGPDRLYDVAVYVECIMQSSKVALSGNHSKANAHPPHATYFPWDKMLTV